MILQHVHAAAALAAALGAHGPAEGAAQADVELVDPQAAARAAKARPAGARGADPDRAEARASRCQSFEPFAS